MRVLPVNASGPTTGHIAPSAWVKIAALGYVNSASKAAKRTGIFQCATYIGVRPLAVPITVSLWFKRYQISTPRVDVIFCTFYGVLNGTAVMPTTSSSGTLNVGRHSPHQVCPAAAGPNAYINKYATIANANGCSIHRFSNLRNLRGNCVCHSHLRC